MTLIHLSYCLIVALGWSTVQAAQTDDQSLNIDKLSPIDNLLKDESITVIAEGNYKTDLLNALTERIDSAGYSKDFYDVMKAAKDLIKAAPEDGDISHEKKTFNNVLRLFAALSQAVTRCDNEATKILGACFTIASCPLEGEPEVFEKWSEEDLVNSSIAKAFKKHHWKCYHMEDEEEQVSYDGL